MAKCKITYGIKALYAGEKIERSEVIETKGGEGKTFAYYAARELYEELAETGYYPLRSLSDVIEQELEELTYEEAEELYEKECDDAIFYSSEEINEEV